MERPRRQDLVARAERFSVRVLLLSARLREERRLSFRTIDQFTDAGTAIASNLSEAQSSITRKRMAWYYSIALGEARETTWLRVLQAVWHGDPSEVAWLLQEASEFVAMQTVSVKKPPFPFPLSPFPFVLPSLSVDSMS